MMKKHKENWTYLLNLLHNAPALYLSCKLQFPNSNEGIVDGTWNFPIFLGWHVPHLITYYTLLTLSVERKHEEGRYG
jgi:hypothetical protein